MCDKHTLHPFGGRHAKNKTYRAFVQTNIVFIDFDLDIWQEYNFNASVGNVPLSTMNFISLSTMN